MRGREGSESRTSRVIASALAITGATLAAGTSAVAALGSETGGGLAGLAFALWALFPYALLVLLGRVTSNPWVVGGAGLLGLACECGVRASVFLFPRGSTAAIGLVFAPAWIALVALPAGAAAGFVLGRLWRIPSGALRGAVGVAGAAGLGLVVLGLARPELFPTSVWKRRQLLERLGPPRVVAGADAVETRWIAERPGWFRVGELDGAPGDELAIVGPDLVDLVDPVTAEVKLRVPIGEPGRHWNWFSLLARSEGSLVVVQGGGGYSDTEVRSLDGRVLWTHRPDPDLPPSALRPGDLDRDGQVEFYSSSTRALARLDPHGREVWSRPTRMATLLALAPGTPDSPAWVVGYEFGRVLSVWDERGRELGRLPVTAKDVPIGVGDFPRERSMIFGGATVRAVGLDGTVRFVRPMPTGLTVGQALSLRVASGAAPLLAVVATAPRDADRSRLVVLEASGRIRYDEVLAGVPQLLKTTSADGTETLFVSAAGLRRLGF